MRDLPGRDAGDLEWLFFEQDGVLARSQARAFFSDTELRRRVTSGRWSHPHRGIYVTHNGALSPDQRTWVGVLSAVGGRRVPVAGVTALGSLGMHGVATATVHVLIPARLRSMNPPADVVVHRTSVLPPAHIVPGLLPRTSAARSVVDAAQWSSDDNRARALIASAFQQRLVDGAAIAAVVARLSRVRRRRLIIESARDAEAGSESILELDLVRLCRSGGLPVPTRQSDVIDASGRRRYRDGYIEEWKIHIEVDGSQHMNAAQWWADMRRQNDMWVSGDRVLRFPAWALRNDPKAVIAQIRAALLAAGWRP